MNIKDFKQISYSYKVYQEQNEYLVLDIYKAYEDQRALYNRSTFRERMTLFKETEMRET